MKINKILMGLGAVAALSLGACSNDEPANAGNNGDGETKYLAVTITTSTEAAPMGRAEAAPVFEDGLDAESAVKTLDFYFFDANDEPAKVKADGTNHLSVTEINTVEEDPVDDNITKTIKAVLVISTKANDQVPSKILAVVNDKTDYKGLKIAELQATLTEGINEIEGTKYFVMTNSVHLDAGTEVVATPVAGHLFTREDAAMKNPVTIYVERTLGKVRVESKLTAVEGMENTFVTGDEKGYNDKEIYVKFLGWNVTTLSTNNRLVKDINPAWNTNGAWVWNASDYHRSFWAFNAPDNTYNYYDFDRDGATAANALTKFDGTDYTYLKENAATNYANGRKADNTFSQVIIAAQLVDKTGAPVEFAEWAGQRMTKDALKIALADALSLYTGEPYAEGEEFSRTKITPNDIELKTAAEAGYVDLNNPAETGRYLVYAALTPAARAKAWYASTETSAKPLDSDARKAAFKALGGAKVWTGGKTYYYFDINHLGTTGTFGAKGVVRNHVYDAKITSLTGLGTPVYNPDEIIIPEKPNEENTYIAAEIKVLSWRVVGFNADLDW